MPSINRVVMQRTSRKWLEELPLHEMDAAEISGKTRATVRLSQLSAVPLSPQ